MVRSLLSSSSGQWTAFPIDTVGHFLVCALAAGCLLTACDNAGTGETELAIDGFDPQKGSAGTEVIIAGSGFGTDAADVSVTFGGTEAQVTDVGRVLLGAVVPDGATDGPIEVTVEGETASTTPEFDVIPRGTITFASDRDGNSEIYTVKPDGSGLTRVTNNSVPDLKPAWSADGSTIVFQSVRDGGSDIYSIAPDGSGLREITSDTEYAGSPVWSPIGPRIAYEFKASDTDIYAINVDGSDRDAVTLNVTEQGAPAWSPDGERIVYHSNSEGNEEIFTIRKANAQNNGTDLQRVTSNPARDVSPAWSPDGKRIAFESDRNGNSEIYTIDPDGTDLERVTNNAAIDSDPVWSPEGERIAFTSDRGGNEEVYTIRPDGSGLTQVTTSTAFDGSPAWRSSQ